jgi:hypothetical protein
MPTRNSVAKAVREDRDRKPWLFYGPRSLWRSKRGDEIVSLRDDRRAEVLSSPSFRNGDGNGILIRYRTGVVTLADARDFRHVDQTLDSAYGRKGR